LSLKGLKLHIGLLGILLILSSGQAGSQSLNSNVRRVIGAAGDQVSASSLRLSYTIGEAVVHTGRTQERIYTQGFQQGPMAVAESFDVEVYNAFSPNGDGTNETWIIDRIRFYPDNEVLIFNRWGDRLHRFEGYDNEEKVWEGKNSNGQALPAGTYYYVIKTGNGRTKKGYVQITK
jgi:gliding motility-associated-like protein